MTMTTACCNPSCLSAGSAAALQLPQVSAGATVRFCGSAASELPGLSVSSFPVGFREGPGPALCPDQDLHELLLDLMCQFDPQQLLAFLHTSQHYRLEEAILVCVLAHSRVHQRRITHLIISSEHQLHDPLQNPDF